MPKLITNLQVTPIAHGDGPIRATTALLGDDSVYLQVADEVTCVSMGIHPSVARHLAGELVRLAALIDGQAASPSAGGE